MVYESVLRVILSYKRRLARVLKKRKPLDKLKRKAYYRAHKRQINLRRKKYLQKNKPFLKTRKLHKRVKPSWATRKKTLVHKKPRIKVIRPKKRPPLGYRPVFKPKVIRPKKIHAPRRK
jgi:hypothetical protein